MDGDPRTRLCPNCKREVPEFNFVIHSVYCTRNLKICQQCKEPVAISDMEKHTAQVPCPQCGEVMQACDIPSHKTDACSLTQIQCAYCEITLERALMADHELYCGTRTEKCSECSELVMIKYRKLHEESNHGFLKLDDEPGPLPSWVIAQNKSEKSKSSSKTSHKDSSLIKKSKKHLIENEVFNVYDGTEIYHPSHSNHKSSAKDKRVSHHLDSQENSSAKEVCPTSRGAIKKRIAPQPNQSIQKALTKTAFNESAYQSKQKKEHKYPDLVDIPSFSSNVDKVDKIRKSSALQNYDHNTDKEVLKSCNKSMSFSKDNQAILPKSHNLDRTKDVNIKVDSAKKKIEFLEYNPNLDVFIPLEDRHSVTSVDKTPTYNSKNLAFEKPPKNSHNMSTSKLCEEENVLNVSKHLNSPKNLDSESKQKHKNKKVENQQRKLEFLEYTDNGLFISKPEPVDRFPGIKNDLRALRQELKNCTSPLINRSQTSQPKESNIAKDVSSTTENSAYELYKITNEVPSTSSSVSIVEDVFDDNLHNVMLPCEFCEQMICADMLVSHETGCRPSLTCSPPKKSSVQNIAPPNSPDGSFKPKLSNVGKNKCAIQRRTKNDINTLIQPENLSEEDLAAGELDEVKLPCEFCMSLIPACRLVWHQQACLISI